MMGSLGMFLLFNWQPAKLFMGDVGSLMLGAAASMTIATGAWWMLLGFGAICVIETLSVIIQVISYRYRKSVCFNDPTSSSFELLGMSDTAVVILFGCIRHYLQ